MNWGWRLTPNLIFAVEATSKHEACFAFPLLHSDKLSQKAVKNAIIRVWTSIYTKYVIILQPTRDSDD